LKTCFDYVQKTMPLEKFVAHTVKPSTGETGNRLKFIAAGNATEKEWNENLHHAGLLESYERLLADVVTLRERSYLKVAENRVLLLSPLISMGKVQGIVSALCSFEEKKD